jgi:hypothetical protein
MICYKRYTLVIGELWFAEEPAATQTDVFRFRHRPQPVPRAHCVDKWSIQVDLTQPSEQLFAGFKQKTRQKMRSALEKDKVAVSVFDGNDPAVFARFCHYYDQFARLKGLTLIDVAHLRLYAEASRLVFTCARDVQGDDLVWHSCLLCGDRVSVLHSASQFRASDDSGFRNCVGRANRFLHWQNMLHFQAHGYVAYDFGGWYAGQADQERLGVNRFKEEFGGRIVHEYDCSLGVSRKGQLALTLKRLLGRAERR